MTTDRDALEAAIDESPDDAARYAVLGDWLLQAGDPRGELISLQLAPSSRRKKEREEKLILTNGIRVAQTQRALWRWGFVHTLYFGLVQHAHWEERRDDWTTTLLAPALLHPSCRFLRELVIDAGPGDDVLRYLSEHPPRVLTSLSLTCNEVDLANVGAGLRALTRLHLYAQLIVPSKVTLPSLLELSLPADALSLDGLSLVLEAVPSVQKLTLSSLETFDRQTVFPATRARLTSLTLRAEKTTRSAVEAIIDSPLRESLQALDVSRSGMTEDAAHLLLEAAPKFARLDSLLLGDSVESWHT